MRIGYIFLTCYMYKSSLRHIHDPVLSSLKMKGIRTFFFHSGLIYRPSEQPYAYQRGRAKRVQADRVGRYPLQSAGCDGGLWRHRPRTGRPWFEAVISLFVHQPRMFWGPPSSTNKPSALAPTNRAGNQPYGRKVPYIKIDLPHGNPRNQGFGCLPCDTDLPHIRCLFTYTSWSKVLLEKLTGFSYSSNSPHFMEPKGSNTAFTSAYSEPARSSPFPHIPLPKDPF
jgi:hypothetical protein